MFGFKKKKKLATEAEMKDYVSLWKSSMEEITGIKPTPLKKIDPAVKEYLNLKEEPEEEDSLLDTVIETALVVNAVSDLFSSDSSSSDSSSSSSDDFSGGGGDFGGGGSSDSF